MNGGRCRLFLLISAYFGGKVSITQIINSLDTKGRYVGVHVFYFLTRTLMTNNNFKGKVVYYSNINGKENRVEKEFDSQEVMNRYIDEQDGNFSRMPRSFGFPGNDWFSSWFDDFFDQKLQRVGLTPVNTALGYDSGFDELQRKKADIQAREHEQEKQKSFLEKRLAERKHLKEFFSKRKDNEAVAKAEEGIKNCQEQLESC